MYFHFLSSVHHPVLSFSVSALKNWCFWTVVLEKTLESPLDCKKLQPVHSRGDQSWVFFERTDAEAETPVLWCEELTHWERPWCWEGLGAGGEGDDRGWDGWMASLTQWTWVWVTSRSWWWTGRLGVLRFVGSQRVGHDWVTELNLAYSRKQKSSIPGCKSCVITFSENVSCSVYICSCLPFQSKDLLQGDSSLCL